MDLHGGDSYRLQGVQNGNRGMGISGGVDNDAVVDPVGGLDGVHQRPFVVGLELGDLSPHFPPRLLQQGKQGGKVLLSIDPRLPDPQHIQIGAVDH